MWYARPDIRQNNPALWTPAGVTTDGSGQAAIFFIHPTSYLERSKWNATLDDKESADRARLFIPGQASALNNEGQIWAPSYRQATFAAFLTGQTDAQLALRADNRALAAAFDYFLSQDWARPFTP